MQAQREKNMTELKKAEDTVRYNALLLQNVSDAVISTDEKFIIKSWNQAAEKMYGYRASEVIGKDIAVLDLKLSDENLRKQRESAKPQGYHQDEYIVKDKNGNELTILASVNEISSDGKLSGYVA